ncbi:MAG: YihA family ribosome biogenesis GTP-binding protein [Deltaproteobacteria bacterium]|nr:YihA family ribosome biogenesis GTP-binding protein [Deltaproteobacteria bacterium]
MNASFLVSAFRESQYPPADKPEAAFAGRSNVGKSSLINVLLKRKKLARTSATPGRTQAINFFAVNGLFYAVDLPGYGFARVPLKVKASWAKMTERYLSGRANLKAVVVILDIRRGPSEGDMDLLDSLQRLGKKAVVVLTKADKLSRQQCRSKLNETAASLTDRIDGMPILFSAKTGEGRGEIWLKLLEAIGIDSNQDRKT